MTRRLDAFAGIVALAFLLGLGLGGTFGFGLGTSEPLPPPHAWRDSVAALRFEVDVLAGKTAAGREMCREALEANPFYPMNVGAP